MLTGPHKKAEAAPCGTASFLLQRLVDELLQTLASNVSRSSLISGIELPPWASISAQFIFIQPELQSLPESIEAVKQRAFMP